MHRERERVMIHVDVSIDVVCMTLKGDVPSTVYNKSSKTTVNAGYLYAIGNLVGPYPCPLGG